MKIHLVAVCGTGMGSLAGLLQAAGHQVSGSDKAFYPPMSEKLQQWNIHTYQGFDQKHITAELDLVVVGNACRKDNPEAVRAQALGLKVMSFPECLDKLFIRTKQSLMACGTHGKTTTSSLIAYLLYAAGLDPSFLIGGVLSNFDTSFRLGAGDVFVVEGDEYDSAYFDKRPKFVHYQPNVVVLTSLEYDHADIYPDMQAYRNSFAMLMDMLPSQGLLVACADDAEVMQMIKRANCQVLTYGLDPKAALQAFDLSADGVGMRFCLRCFGQTYTDLYVPMSGRHNVANTLACLAVGKHIGIELTDAIDLLQGFQGVRRRMQERGTVAGVTVVDDFAHHPTEVRATVSAARQRYAQRQLVAVFEPRTNTSRRNVFQQEYTASFDDADWVIVVPPFATEQIEPQNRFDSQVLVQQLQQRGKEADILVDADAVVKHLVGRIEPDAVLLVMSNGAFGNIHEKLLQALDKQ